MLKRSPSLKLRGAVIFTTIYLAIHVAIFFYFGSDTLSTEGERPHAGPDIAIGYVIRELRHEPDSLVIPERGILNDLARSNPDLWILSQRGGERVEIGPVPGSAVRLAEGDFSQVRRARFRASELAYPLSESVLARRRNGDVVMVGGVDPATISTAVLFDHYRHNGMFVMLLVLGIVGLAAILIAIPFMTAALKPATRQLALIEGDQPEHRIPERIVPGEILPLVRGVNKALDRLQLELSRRRRFIADAAHELKTPLAILTLQVESLDDTPTRRDMKRTVDRLSTLVAQMLDVQRLSLGGQRRSQFDLNAMASHIVSDLAPLALASGYELSLEASDQPVVVQGDMQALGRALANLVGNAIAHAGGQGDIRVVVSEQGFIDVIDHGPGLPAHVRKNLFEPFARGQWDRDGCGLGLHLTREIMRAHGGDAALVDADTGAHFRLIFAAEPALSAGSAAPGEDQT